MKEDERRDEVDRAGLNKYSCTMGIYARLQLKCETDGQGQSRDTTGQER